MMPGGMLNSNKKADESYTFLIGTVISMKDVTVEIGEITLPFILAQVDTALGIIPVAMGREVFDLSNLKNGSIVAMNADIKADLAKESYFTPTGK